MKINGDFQETMAVREIKLCLLGVRQIQFRLMIQPQALLRLFVGSMMFGLIGSFSLEV